MHILTLDDNQNKIISFLDYQLDQKCNQKLIIIQGKAGTGKSFVINFCYGRKGLRALQLRNGQQR